MSIAALAWAWKQKAGSPAHKVVLIAIADFASDEGIAWPSLDTIAETAEISRRTAIRIIRDLEDLDLLRVNRDVKRESGASSSNHYLLPLSGPQMGLWTSLWITEGGVSKRHPGGVNGVTPYEPSLEEELKTARRGPVSVDKSRSRH